MSNSSVTTYCEEALFLIGTVARWSLDRHRAHIYLGWRHMRLNTWNNRHLWNDTLNWELNWAVVLGTVNWWYEAKWVSEQRMNKAQQLGWEWAWPLVFKRTILPIREAFRPNTSLLGWIHVRIGTVIWIGTRTHTCTHIHMRFRLRHLGFYYVGFDMNWDWMVLGLNKHTREHRQDNTF